MSFLREIAAVLLLAPDQETGIVGIDGKQFAAFVAGGVEPFIGATSDLVRLIADNGRCVAEASGDGRDDPPFAVADIMFVEHFVSSHL